VGKLYSDFGFKPQDTKILIVTPEQVFAEYMTLTKVAGTGRLIHHLLRVWWNAFRLAHSDVMRRLVICSTMSHQCVPMSANVREGPFNRLSTRQL
jgi:hypothetical protein